MKGLWNDGLKYMHMGTNGDYIFRVYFCGFGREICCGRGNKKCPTQGHPLP